MNKKYMILLFSLACASSVAEQVYAENNSMMKDMIESSSKPVSQISDYRYLSLQMDDIDALYTKIQNRDKQALEFYNALLKQADEEINRNKTYTVVNKTDTPPSGSKHDYVSMAPYFWPNPDTKDGIPYVYRDGRINPETKEKNTDQAELNAMADAVWTLGQAYYYSKENKYVERMNAIVNSFFLDSKTMMNPNFNFSQYAKGSNNGRPAGIIASAVLTKAMEGIALASDSKALSKETLKGVKEWMNSYLKWLQTNRLGITEGNTKNNHSTHYDRISLTIMLFTDNVDDARNYIKTRTMPRLQEQIKPDGSQPQEMRRSKSWNYTNMNMLGFYYIALMSEKVGVDLWNYQKNGNVYLKNMVDWFLPYLSKEKVWNFTQIQKEPVSKIEEVLRIAAKKYNSPKYLKAIDNFQTINKNICE